MSVFRKELAELLKKHSKEDGSNTPDIILAAYLERCLEVFDMSIKSRETWRDGDKK